MWTLEDTLSGYLLNQLLFCSSSGSTNLAYTSCPAGCVTRANPFWNAASLDFAKRASGYISIMLNGSRTAGAIFNGSTFFLYELPNLDSSRVKQLTVVLLHSPDQAVYETCYSPKTLGILEDAMAAKNIAYKCVDDPIDVVYLMCFYQPDSKQCQSIQKSSNYTSFS